MEKLLIKNGRVLDPANHRDEQLDILIENGRIARLEKNIPSVEGDLFDAGGFVVAPGFIDMHAHLREPGREDQETLESGSRAAAAGGFTSVACMPDTDPVNDNASVTDFILTKASREALVNILPVGAISRGLQGEVLAEFGDMKKAGIVAVSNGAKPMDNSMLLRRAMEYASMFDLPVIDHCEDTLLSGDGVMNEGYYSTLLGLRGMPAASETVTVMRDIELAALTGASLHLTHVSTANALEAIARAKDRGLPVTADVTPYHFSVLEKDLDAYDTNLKVKPPLRSEKDRDGLNHALQQGLIDAIATNHSPWLQSEKEVEFMYAPFGMVGLETAVSLALDRLVHHGVIDLSRMVSLFSYNPAKILRLERGSLSPGAVADITILDTEREVVVDTATFQSRSRNSPFHGWKLRGGPVATIVGGKIVWKH